MDRLMGSSETTRNLGYPGCVFFPCYSLARTLSGPLMAWPSPSNLTNANDRQESTMGLQQPPLILDTAQTRQTHLRPWITRKGARTGDGTTTTAPLTFPRNAAYYADDLDYTWSVRGFCDAEHDVLLALVNWVGKGKAVESVVATTWNVRNDSESGIPRQRPSCPYPGMAVYDGERNVNEAATVRLRVQRVLETCGVLGGPGWASGFLPWSHCSPCFRFERQAPAAKAEADIASGIHQGNEPHWFQKHPLHDIPAS